MSPAVVLGIKIPAEAVIPLLVVVAVVLVLVFAGSGLLTWKAKHPQSARIAGIVFAVGLTGVAGYILGKVLTETLQRHPVYNGIIQVGFIEGPIVGFCGSAFTRRAWRSAAGARDHAARTTRRRARSFQARGARGCVPTRRDLRAARDR